MEGGKDVSAKAMAYRMSVLQNNPYMDAFTAQIKAGSKKRYFKLLTEFTEIVPQIQSELKFLQLPQDTRQYLKQLVALQSWTLAVGAAQYTDYIEKLCALLHEDNPMACRSALSRLFAKLNLLCVYIESARMNEKQFTIQAKKQNQQQVESGCGAQSAVNNAEACEALADFEKISLFVSNYEAEQALEMLREQMLYSHGGEVDRKLEATAGALTSFQYEKAMETMNQLLRTAKDAGHKIKDIPKKKILAVDDVPDILHSIRAVLRSRYPVYGVTNHSDALKFLATNNADLILLDIEMPNMDGFTLLNAIRQTDAYRDIPVILLTGCASEENVRRSVEAGANDFIRKPINARILISKIQKNIQKGVFR